MLTHARAREIQDKIMELEQALFFNLSEAVLKLPSCTIKALHADEAGQVWFFVHRPLQHIHEFEKVFPAKLNFYKKGKSFYLHATGRARMVTDPEEINMSADISPAIFEHLDASRILIKFRIAHVHVHAYPNAVPASSGESQKFFFHPSALIKSLQYIVKDVIPVFQSH